MNEKNHTGKHYGKNSTQNLNLQKKKLGGPDPLDYISMYYNAGNPSLNISPHWHYQPSFHIGLMFFEAFTQYQYQLLMLLDLSNTFGLSDLHGDGRVHEVSEPNLPSGFGFELTMRVRCEEGEKSPPTWPATLMQNLARYLFQTDSIFCAGDHVSWHTALDNSDSKIQHMLICEDLQLTPQNTPLGKVQFLQIVGLTSEELQAAQRWNGLGVLSIMKRFPECGGSWHVTDMKREESVFDIDSSIREEIENGIEKEGSNLSGVSAKVSRLKILEALHLSIKHEQVQNTFTSCQNNFGSSSPPYTMLRLSSELKDMDGKHADYLSSDCKVQFLPSLHLTINLESGSLLPLALRGRLKHGRHFTFKSPLGVGALTLLTPSVEGGFVTLENPYGIKGSWLQVLIDEELLETMSNDLTSLTNIQDSIVGQDAQTITFKQHVVTKVVLVRMLEIM
ncbi:Suppressor of fused-like protein [Armadillidium nasatum]|uniref:Suppressor of fused-like protein n=1 Tax=Armadillidium nasatum TaxID=96803 RepID=A0A5N5T961_9CRUS|nr:Suppressor of fused-like protein [Armadillidium nasatum]